MKRIAYSFFLFLVLLPASGFAQGRVMYGVTGGVDIGSRYEVPISDGFSSYSTGSALGALAGFEIGYFNWDHFSYSAQILFDQKGYTKPLYGNKEYFSMNYIEIPLLIKIPVIRGEWKAYVFAGPTIGFFINGVIILPDGSGTLKYSQDTPALDYGLYGGVGLSHSISQDVDLYIDLGYDYGLKDVSGPIYYILPQGSSYYKEYFRDIRIYFGFLFGKE